MTKMKTFRGTISIDGKKVGSFGVRGKTKKSARARIKKQGLKTKIV